MYCSPPGFSVHDILQARGLEWVAIALSDDNHEDCGNVKMSVYGNSKTYETIYIVFKWRDKDDLKGAFLYFKLK